MLKIFAAIIIAFVGLAVFYFGLPALIGVAGISVGLFISEALDKAAVMGREVTCAADEDEDVRPARKGR